MTNINGLFWEDVAAVWVTVFLCDCVHKSSSACLQDVSWWLLRNVRCGSVTNISALFCGGVVAVLVTAFLCDCVHSNVTMFHCDKLHYLWLWANNIMISSLRGSRHICRICTSLCSAILKGTIFVQSVFWFFSSERWQSTSFWTFFLYRLGSVWSLLHWATSTSTPTYFYILKEEPNVTRFTE